MKYSILIVVGVLLVVASTPFVEFARNPIELTFLWFCPFCISMAIRWPGFITLVALSGVIVSSTGGFVEIVGRGNLLRPSVFVLALGVAILIVVMSFAYTGLLREAEARGGDSGAAKLLRP